MALGDLSSDQARFVDRLAAATGIDRQVIVAWVGTESGWGVTKHTHNYLNVGPGETYPSTEAAVSRAASLIRNSGHYSGIRSAAVAGGPATVTAIVDSPWGTGPLIGRVYQQLTGLPAAVGASLTEVGVRIPGTDIDVPYPWEVPRELGEIARAPLGAVGEAIVGSVARVLGPVTEQLVVSGLTMVLTVAGLVLVVLGVWRLTNSGPREVFDKGAGIAGGVGIAGAVT